MNTAREVTGPARVVLHPDRPPGVHGALLALAGDGVIELVDAASEDETAAALRGPDSILVSYQWRDDFLVDGLAWIQTLSVGVDRFPLERLAAAGVTVCNAGGVMVDCVSEQVFAVLLAMTRRIITSYDDQRAHRWTPRIGAELSQLSMGILGLGAVGREVAERAQAFGMEVLGTRRSPGPVEHVDELVGLDELCRRSDVLVCCLPGGPDTRGMVGREQLDALGEGWLVNVGRGSTLDESALIDALRAGRLRGAALDVVDGEPLAADSPLWDTPRLLITSHSAALSPRWGASWATLFQRNLATATRGGPRANTVGKVPNGPESR